MTLLKDTFQRAYKLITPQVRKEDDREALLLRAFYDRQWILDQIKLEGAPSTFATLLLKHLDDIGCSNGVHPITELLSALLDEVGVDQQSEIQTLCATANDTCRGSAESLELAPGAPLVTTLQRQTSATPMAQRQPSVFLIYAEKDDTWLGHWLAPELTRAGISYWDGTLIDGLDDEYKRLTQEGIHNSYAVVVVLSDKLTRHGWARKQLLWAREKRRPIYGVYYADGPTAPDTRLDGSHPPSFDLGEANFAAGIRALLEALPIPRQIEDTPGRERMISQRWLELLYLDFLRFERTLEADRIYTELAGTSVEQVASTRDVFGDEMQQIYELHERTGAGDSAAGDSPRRFEDAVQELVRLRRAVVLGEPGAGKSTTLEKLAAHLADQALRDRTQPIPLLIRLGHWTNPKQLIRDFIAAQLGELAPHLDALLAAGRAALLLDGLNEMPVAQRNRKSAQLRAFISDYENLIAVITCREQDYLTDLGFARVVITPLDPLRIRTFAQRHLGPAIGTTLFYKLAGAGSQWEEQQFQTSYAPVLPTWERAFWVETRLPNVPDARDIWRWHWDDWLAQRDAPASLLVLACNPYLLRMLCDVYRDTHGQLPANRAALFGAFAARLLQREHLTPSNQTEILAGLERVAWRMQEQRAAAGPMSDSGVGNPNAGDGALTVLMYADAIPHMSARLLRLAASASLIEFGATVRFSHQLLQEYFVARAMDTRIQAGTLKATDLWPADRFWERTNWEEATVILAGLYSDDCTPLLEWLADANPEVTAQCMLRSGAHHPAETLIRLRDRWLPRLTDWTGEPDPRARAAVGRAIGLLPPINGLTLDCRVGIGNRDGIPEIDWVRIQGGTFAYGDNNQKLTLPDDFEIARYPITHAQFQVFIDDPHGFAHPEWWHGLAADDEHKQQPGEQAFKYWNHPRERVSWYDAVAFCRWLSAQLNRPVRLPTEHEWEYAARGPWIDSGAHAYPYVGAFDSLKANTAEGKSIGQTSAVGIYPNGASPFGLMDMSGNVWEWCLSEFDNPQIIQLSRAAARVVRGGSWDFSQNLARATSRVLRPMSDRDYDFGFRVVRSVAVRAT